MVLQETNSQWREQLLGMLRNLPPASFEEVCRRFLSGSGFDEVRITGRPGDGGIDGFGIVRMAGLVNFPVAFQCKRYRRKITAPMVRDFQAALLGRADRGLFITTSEFTEPAIREARRDGAPKVDLIDSELLLDKLKELQIGVTVTIVQTEAVEVNPHWFANI